MSTIRQNLFANFAGQAWMALISFLCVPFYLRFIGAEGYGLIGFFFLMSSTLSLLDMGFDLTAMRQIAAFTEADEQTKSRIVTLLRSIEVFFWTIALLIGILVGLAAPLLATHWLNVETRRIAEVTDGIRLMALALLIQFPTDFYSGCHIGLQKQIKLNVINSTSATLRGGGVVLALWLIAPTVHMFFLWQCVVNIVSVFWLRHSVWRLTGHCSKSKRFDIKALREVGNYTAGVGGINLLGYLLMQIDKIIISKVLPLRTFGYYTLSWNLGTFGYRLIGPIFYAYYPRISQLVTQTHPDNLVNPQPTTELVELYLKASRVMAVVLVPFCVWLAFYAQSLLALWTHDQEIARTCAGAVALIALGTLFQGFMHIPYAVQLASGRLKLPFWFNFVSVFLIVPLTYFFATQYGLTGAAVPWFLLNIATAIICSALLYRQIMKTARWDWYRSAVAYPFLQATILMGASYYVSRQLNSTLGVSVLVFLSLLASTAVVAWYSKIVKIADLVRFYKAFS